MRGHRASDVTVWGPPSLRRLFIVPQAARKKGLRSAPHLVGLLAVVLGFCFSAVVRADSVSGESMGSGGRRFTLLVASTDGGRERARLRYPGKDTEALKRVLTEIGGVADGDIESLVDPDGATVEKRLLALKERAAATPGRKQFFFYYSGHSDERGLLLFGSHLEYSRLRALITDIPVDVHIGILDSCAAGVFAQRKGGAQADPFLLQTAPSLSGHAFLTSTSEREAAQESGRLRGSFFTHALVTGLRGAADSDGDQRVTLQEAYRFAFDETLARTEATLGGPQHATYDIQLAGRGDLVLTDLRSGSARLTIPEGIAGRMIVRDSRGALAAEVSKPTAGAKLSLSLQPGNYRVTFFEPQRVRRGLVTLPPQGVELLLAELRDVPIEVAVARGSSLEAAEQSEAAPPTEEDPIYRVLPGNAGIVPPWSVNAIEKTRPVINYFSLNLGWGRAARLYGAEIGVVGAYVTEEVAGLQASTLFAVSGGRLRGAQTTFGVNIVRGEAFGGQFGTVNVAQSDLTGLQAASVNYSGGDLRGLQLGAFNLARGGVYGLQAGSVTYAARMYGLQLGGLAIAGQVSGMQVSGINIASGRVRGVQLGIINIADDADVAIGMFSISKKYGAFVDLWMSDSAAINVSLRFPARYSYSLVSFGVHPAGAGAGWQYGLGFGFHAPLSDKLYGEIDDTVFGVQPGFASLQMPSLLNVTRLTLGVRIARRFAVFGGMTFNMQWGFKEGEDPLRPGFDLGSANSPRPQWRMWPGFALGMTI